MLLLEQLQLRFANTGTLTSILSTLHPVASPGRTTKSLGEGGSIAFRFIRDVDLELKAHELLRALGASRIAADVRVEWNSRLKTCAGRANFRTKVVSLNPRLREHPTEIERTLRHELAHFLAQFRTGRRRILPHGEEWRNACRDLGIGDEKRCHNLPFPIRERARRFIYKCPNCHGTFSRVRQIRRAIACLACCRAHSRGRFDARFRLRLVNGRDAPPGRPSNSK
jgi:SprT protein